MTDLLTAVRFVEGSDDLVEGLGIPFGGPLAGRDLTGWYFTPETDLALEWFGPGERPALYDHGLDQSGPALEVIGRAASYRMTDKGLWVQTQLDRASEWYDAVRKLLGEKALGYSSGSIEHLASIRRDGRIERWPWIEITLTPIRANPDAAVSYYSIPTDVATRHLAAIGVDKTPPELAAPPAVEAPATSAAAPTPPVRGIQTFADIQASIVLDEELPAAFDTLRSAIYGAVWAYDEDMQPASRDAKEAAIAQSLDEFRAYVLGILDRAARSAPIVPPARRDRTGLQTIHDATRDLGANCGTGATRSAPEPARLVITTGTAAPAAPDLDALTAAMTAHATAKARELLGKT